MYAKEKNAMQDATTALAIREINLSTWETIKAIAPTMRTSGLFGVPNEAAAAAIMLKGYELGLGLTAAFEFVHIIEGKPSLSPRGAFAIVQQSGLLEEFEIVEESNPVKCTVTMKRKGGIKYTTSYSVKDAEAAGLVKDKGNWAKYPANMCRWRAIGYVIDMVFPDITGGLKRSDELGAEITAQGDVIEGTWTPAQPVSQPAKKDDTAAKNQLAALINEHGVTKIMEANNGALPTSPEDIAAVSQYLAVQSVPMTPEEADALKLLEF